jgi:hypothetical protein
MRAGETAAIPFPFKTLAQKWEITTPLPRRALLLVVALLGASDTPDHAIRRGSEAYASELDKQLDNNWSFLLDDITRGDIASLNETIKKIRDAVTAKVKKAIEDDLSGPEVLVDQDEFKGVDYYFSQISEQSVRTPLSLSFSSEERVKTDPNYVGGTKWAPWASVAGGQAAPGSPITVVQWGRGQWPLAVFVTGTDGGIYTTAGNPQTGFPGGWASVAGGQAAPGSPVTVVPWGQWPFAVFVTGTDGGIYTTAGNPQDGFPGGWASVAGGQAAPGSPVTVVPWGQWPFAVFVTGTDGGIYTTAGNPQDGFPGGWASVAGGAAAPGSPVTVVPWGQWPLAVFVTGTDSGIYTTAGNPQDGFPGGWAPVGGQAALGSPITAVPWGQKFALFVTGLDGVIYTTGGDPQTGFGSWESVPGIKARPGSPVTAVAFGDGLALFVTDVDGGIYTTSSRFPDYTIDGMFEVGVT